MTSQPPESWITRHFRWYRTLEPWPFCWRIALEGMVLSMLVAAFCMWWGMSERNVAMSKAKLIVVALLIAPPLETLLLQAFPVFIARVFGANLVQQVVVANVAFALAHAPNGTSSFLAAGVVAGFYLSFTYAHWREKSRWTAFWVTTLSHFLHNSLVFFA